MSKDLKGLHEEVKDAKEVTERKKTKNPLFKKILARASTKDVSHFKATPSQTKSTTGLDRDDILLK